MSLATGVLVPTVIAPVVLIVRRAVVVTVVVPGRCLLERREAGLADGLDAVPVSAACRLAKAEALARRRRKREAEPVLPAPVVGGASRRSGRRGAAFPARRCLVGFIDCRSGARGRNTLAVQRVLGRRRLCGVRGSGALPRDRVSKLLVNNDPKTKEPADAHFSGLGDLVVGVEAVGDRHDRACRAAHLVGGRRAGARRTRRAGTVCYVRSLGKLRLPNRLANFHQTCGASLPGARRPLHLCPEGGDGHRGVEDLDAHSGRSPMSGKVVHDGRSTSYRRYISWPH